jgi:Zn-dependent peptidase ImmA (M78 family)
VLTQRYRPKGRLQIELYDRSKNDDPAYVTFKPLTLHIDRKIWTSAGDGEAYARYVVAHEIGHIVLHDEFAVAFSDKETAQLKYLQDEESGEWQANIFAGYFLAPDHVALKLQDPDVLAGLCVITDELAARRLTEAKNTKIILNPTYEGEMCSGCGSFTLVRNGTDMKCDTCGTTGCA